MFRIRLKTLREERGYSQYTLADILGVSQSAVGSWESGVREPKLDTIQRIADFFGVTVDYLIGKDTSDVAVPTVSEFEKLFSQLPEDKQDFVISHMKFLLEQEKKDK